MAPFSIDRLDDLVGRAVDGAVTGHHGRRLRRRGAGVAFDPPPGGWAESAEFEPRPGCRVEALVDGTEALPRIAEEIRGARSHVHLAGWHFAPRFPLGPDGPLLRDLLAETAERVDVRVLCWAGASLPLFHPWRGEVARMRDDLVRGTRISIALDANDRSILHCHHEKLVLVDDRVAFVGGIDLTHEAGDRLDSSEHPRREGLGWHDTCLRVEGPIVADVARHFLMRWRAIATDRTPEPERPGPLAGGIQAQFVRTVPERLYDGCARGEWSILESYLRAVRAAERFVYLESQYLWSPELTDALADKLRNPPRDDFRMIVVLPARPFGGADDTRGQLGTLIEAAREPDDDPTRFLACTLYQPGPAGTQVYVHSKTAIVDDTWLTIGSANLNEHSLFNDTECNVVVHDPELARATRLRLWSEHLERPVEEVGGDPARVFDEIWKPHASEQLERRRAQGWSPHRLSLLPHVSRRSKALLGPLNGLVVDG